MQEFTKELNKLLEKYPDLGEFSIHVRPRLTIQTTTSTISSMTPVVQEPVVEVPRKELDAILSMEKRVNKAKIAELAKSSQIE